MAMDTRNTARDAGDDVVGRVRFHYGGASDAHDRTPELRKSRGVFPNLPLPLKPQRKMSGQRNGGKGMEIEDLNLFE